MATLQELLSDRTKYPDDTKITLADGVETTIGEVRKGYLMESDYRKKTSQVAEAKRNLDYERQQFDAARADAEAKLQAMADRLVRQHPDQSQSELEASLAADPVAKALAEQVKALNVQVQQLKQATGTIAQNIDASRQNEMVSQHRRVLSELRRSDPELDETELVSYARSNYVPRLDLAYRLLTEEKRTKKLLEEATRKAKEEGIMEGKRQAIAPTIPQRARFLAPELDKEAPKSFDEAADRAAQDPEILTLLAEGS